MKNEKSRPTLLRESKSSLPRRGGNYVSDESIRSKYYENLEENLWRQKIFEEEIRADERSKWIHEEEEEDQPFHWGEGSC